MGKAHSDQRDRTLSLIRLLYQESDEDHPFTTQQIVQRLTQAGISVERKSIYRDLAAMNQHGFPVAYRRGAGWYAAGQPFTLAELQGVVDAVAVYRGLPSALREVLLEKLTALAPSPSGGGSAARWPWSPRGGRPPTGSAPCWTGSMRRCSASTPFASSPSPTTTRAPGAWERPAWSPPRECCGARSGTSCWGGTTKPGS